MCREEYLWNVSVLQRVHLYNLVILQEIFWVNQVVQEALFLDSRYESCSRHVCVCVHVLLCCITLCKKRPCDGPIPGQG
jgi:hypothetical protein